MLVRRSASLLQAAGHGRTPAYITELNEYTQPEPEFVRAAYAWLNQLNAEARAVIPAACWCVYDGGATWAAVALNQRPDVLATFQETARIYAPGR